MGQSTGTDTTGATGDKKEKTKTEGTSAVPNLEGKTREEKITTLQALLETLLAQLQAMLAKQ